MKEILEEIGCLHFQTKAKAKKEHRTEFLQLFQVFLINFSFDYSCKVKLKTTKGFP